MNIAESVKAFVAAYNGLWDAYVKAAIDSICSPTIYDYREGAR